MRLEDRELNQARSKPNTVNRPVRTARISLYTIVIVHNTVAQRQFLFIFPFLQTNITSQIVGMHYRCKKVKVKEGHILQKERRRGAHLPFIGR